MYRSITKTPNNKRVFGACFLSFMTLMAPLASVASASPNYSATSAKTTPAPVKATTTSESLDAQEAALFLPSSDSAAIASSRFASASVGVSATAFLPPFAGEVTATMTDSQVAGDGDGDAFVEPGEKITYSVLLDNPAIGSAASGLSFDVPIDSHTTLVPGSIQSTPVAFDKVIAPFNEDAPAQTIIVQGQDPDGTNVTFAIVASPTRGTLGNLGNLLTPTCAADGVCSASITYTPTLNEFGTDSFTFRANDGTANSNQVGTVSITINSVNDAPTFTPPANPGAVNEDVAGQTVSPFVTAISPGPTNEAGQLVDFVIDTNSHSALFAVQPAIGPTGTLTYTPNANANGTALITYHLHDNGGTSFGGVDASSPPAQFTITVNAVNDAPVAQPKAFTVETNMKISGLTGLLSGVTDPDATNGAADPLSFDAAAPAYTTPNVTLANITVNTCQNVTPPATTSTVTITSAATGTFNFDPSPGMTGTCILKYQVTDTGKGSGGNQTSAQADITITHQGPVIWFVDPTRATDGNGTLSDTSAAVGPFNKISSANAKLVAGIANHRVFVYTGSTPIGATEVLTLQSGANTTAAHWLIGQGAVATDFDTLFAINGTVPAGTIARPGINGTRPTVRGTVTMKENTTVRGVNIDVSAAAANSKGLTSGTSALAAGSVILINDVNVTSAAGNAVDFVNGQTITYTGSANVVSSGTGIAVNLSSTTIGAGGMTFVSISANGGTKGIVLNTTGAGAFTVNGTGTTDGSGGTIQNATNRGGEFITASNITLKNMNFTNNGVGGNDLNCADALGASTNTAFVTGGNCESNIHLQSVTTVVLNNVNANDGDAHGINGVGVNGLTLTNVEAQRNGDLAGEDGVQLVNLSGTVNVTGGVFKDNASRSFEVQNNSGSPTITIDGAAFGNTNFPTAGGTAPSPSNSTAQSTVLLATNGSGGAFITSVVKNSSFTKVYSIAFAVDMSNGNNRQNVTFGVAGQGNNITTASQGISILGTNDVTLPTKALVASVVGNTLNNDETLMDTTSTTNINVRRGGGANAASGDWDVTIDGNTVGINGNVLSGCEQAGCSGISADDQGSPSGTFTVLIQNNHVFRIFGAAINVGSANAGAHTVRATVINNEVKDPETAGAGAGAISQGPGIFVFNGTATTCTTYAKIEDNDVDGAWDDVGAKGNIRVRQASNTSTFFLCNFPGPSSSANVSAHLTTENPLSSAPAGFTVASASIGAGATVQNGCPLLLAEGGIMAALTAPSLITTALLGPLATASVGGTDERSFAVALPSNVTASLTQQQLDSTVSTAIERWSATKLTSKQVASLRSIHFDLADLGGTVLGSAQDNRIMVDRKAGGKGWFVDPTPKDDSEFGESASTTRRYCHPMGTPAGHVDLLTAIMHEMGHRLGLDDSYSGKDRDNLMYGELTVGERRLPAPGQAKHSQPGTLKGSHFLSLSRAGRQTAIKTDTRTVRVTTPNNSVAQNAANTVAMEPLMSPLFSGGTFPINGTGTGQGFSLPVGKTITITFKVTVKNPPNFSSTTTNQVSHQGTLSSAVLQPATPVVTDDPDTVTANDATLTTVDLFDTTTTIASVPPTPNSGQSVTYTATVVSNPTGNPTAVGGTVTFKDNGSDICVNVNVSSGTAQCIVPAILVGSHSVVANYNGDGNFDPSASSALLQTVSKGGTTTAVTSSLNPSLVSQNVTFTATVTANTPSSPPVTGTVTFKDGAATISCTNAGGQTLSGGVATCQIANLSAGSHLITAVYPDTTHFTTSTGTLTAPGGNQVVNRSDTTTTLGASPNPSLVSQSVTFTATVASTGVTFTNSGTVTFKNGAATIGTCSAQPISGGQATCILSNLSETTHNISAVYSLADTDPTFKTSTSNTVAQVVNRSNTSTALTSSKNPASPGDTVTFTAMVTSSGVTFTNTGTVTFKDGASTIGACSAQTITAGNATCDLTGLTEGTHNISAVYSGDSTFNTSTSNTVAQVISKTTPTVVVESSVNPSSASQSVTFTAKVTSSNPAEFPGPPAGTIQFKDGATPIGGTVTLTAGACPGGPIAGTVCAVTSTSTLTAGTHTITADYVGDGTANGSATFNNSTGTLPGGQVVNKTNTTTTVTSGGPNPSRFTQSVTFTATVTFTNGAITGPPTGTVNFKYGGISIPGCSSQTLTSAVATCDTSTVPANALPVGSHTITAEYNGDLNFNTSTGAFAGNPQVVNKSDTTTTVVSSMNPSPVVGNSVTFTATVTFVAGVTGPPTGSVIFKDGAATITCTNGGGQTLSGGVATCDVILAQGSHTITAVYSGDNIFNTSTGALTGNPQVIGTCTSPVVVTNSNDDFGGSLRQAIMDVCDGGTITFDPGVSSVTLTSAELTINKNLTITGPGASLLTVQRSSASNFRIFNINSGKTVTISGMTISNGNVVGAVGSPAGAVGESVSGGGVFNAGTLTLLNVIVSNNHATGGVGGANTGAAGGNGGDAKGGGVFSSGSVTLTNTIVNGSNSATGGQGGNSDGIFANGNGGTGYGGGVYNIGATTLTATNSTIAGNTATGGAAGTGGSGGGVAGSGLGGGVYNDGSTIASTTTITNSTINANTASTNGGGIANVGTGALATLTVTNSTISGNFANNDGGGVYNDSGTGTTTFTSVTVTNNRADNDTLSGGTGGGINVVSGSLTFTLKNTIVAGNFVGGTPSVTASDIVGAVAAASSFNLIGTGAAALTGTNNNQVGVADPMLVALANNGGPTQTHALLDGSPALEKGNAFTLTTDQRGLQRPVDSDSTLQGGPYDESDIGAFERQLAAPTIAKAFGPTAIQSGNMSTVTLTLTNPNTSPLTNASFTDTLVNMSAVGGLAGGTCFGANSNNLGLNATSLSFTGITIPANSVTCTVTFNVNSSTAGTHPNATSGVTTAQTTTAGAVSNSASLTVFAAPTIAKAFSPNVIVSGGNSTVTLTLSNSNASQLTSASFTDMLGNMTASGGAAGGDCGNAASNILGAGATSLTFTGLTIPASGSCTVTFGVTSSTSGSNPNFTSGVTTAQTTTAGPASNTANLLVSGSPSIGKVFSPSAIQSGGNSTVTLTLSNGNLSAATNASFTDTLANMSAVGGAVGGSCVGTAPNALAVNATVLSFSGITIPAGGSCTVTFAVKSSTVGSNPNTTSGVTSTQNPTAGAVSNTANLMVLAAPTIVKAFAPTTIQSGGNSTVTLTLSNSNATTALSNASFSDTLVNMSATGGNVTGTCAAAPGTLVAGTTGLNFSGITIPAASSCTVIFDVKSSTVGTNPNATSGVTTTETPTAGAVSNTASLTVLASPTIAKGFSPTTIQSGGTSTVTLTLSNSNATTALSNASFSDTLVNMVAAGGNVTGTCAAAPGTLVAGTTGLVFSGITIPAAGSCTVIFDVTSSTVGVNPNVTSGVTTTQTTTAGAVSNIANLTVLGAPTIAKAFGPAAIQSGGTSTVTLTLSNGNTTTALSNATFSDTLVNMSAAGGSVTGTCAGTAPATLVAGATGLNFSGITIPTNGSCTVIFDVTSTTVGTNPNATSGVTTTQTSTAGAVSNTANLTVYAPPTIAKAFSPTAIQTGSNSTVTLTLSNSNTTAALTNASFSDTLVDMSATGGSVTGTCAGTTPGTLVANATGLNFSGITIPASGSCTVIFDVKSSTVGSNPNATSGVTTAQTPIAGTVSNTANLSVFAPPTVVSITRADLNPTNAASVNFTVTFSKPVTGVDAADFTVTTGGGITLPASPVTVTAGPSATYTVTVATGTGDGSLRLDLVDNDSIMSTEALVLPLGGPGAGNGNFNTGEVYTISKSDPVVSSITRADASPTNATTVNFTVLFSKPVTGVNIGAGSDFALATTGTIAGASITGLSGSGTTYTVTVNTGTGNGTIRLNVLDDDTIIDSGSRPLGGVGAGNGATTALSDAVIIPYTIDKTKPSITSLAKAASQLDPASGPTATTVIHFTVVFDEAVTSFDATDVQITGTSGASLATITEVAPLNGTTYDIGISGLTQSGNVIVQVLAGGAFDLAGNSNNASGTATVVYNKDDFTTFEVNTTLDPGNGVCTPLGTGDGCTLREAISAANADFGAETITFNIPTADPGYNAGTGVYTINLTGALPDLSSNMTISGPGAKVLTVRRNTGGDYRIFTIPSGNNNVTIEGVTITNGIVSEGGGIRNESSGTVSVTNSTISGNSAVFGGGILNNSTGALNITGSTISGNSTITDGGGIFNISTGALNITNSTISGNSSRTNGGGIRVALGTVTITSTTIANNRADDDNNATGTGGGIFQSLGTVLLRNTIVARNLKGNVSQIETATVAGTITSAGDAKVTVTAIGMGNTPKTILVPVVNGDTASVVAGKMRAALLADSDVNTFFNVSGAGANIVLTVQNAGVNDTTMNIATDNATSAGLTASPTSGDTTPGAAADDIVGTVDTANSKFNLIGAGGAGGLVNATNDNLVGVADPGLFPLADNGGGTKTHALQCVSVAIDKGSAFGFFNDQRGGTRPVDLAVSIYPNATGPGADGSDIGAYETQTGGGCLPLAVAPVPAPSTNEDTPVVITLKGTYSQNTPLSFNITQQPTNSTAALVPGSVNCTFTTLMTCTATVNYSPSANYFGPDLFKFTVAAGSGPGALTSDQAEVDITVNPVNDVPVANGQSASTAEDTPVSITLSGSDVESPITFSIVTGPAHGSFGATTPPNLIYTPDADYNGADSFTFKVNDGTVDSANATVLLTITPVNDAPTAVNDSLSSVVEDSAMRTITIASLLGNDSKGPANENLQTLTLSLVGSSEVGGTISSDATNVYFTPAADFNGLASFQYTVTDNGTTNGAPDPKTSAPATVSFTITEINDAPTAVSETISNVAEDSGQRTILGSTLTANDSKGPANESGQTLIVKTVGNAVGGTVSLVGGNVLFTTAADYNGPASFDYTVEDNGTTNGVAAPLSSGTATASFIITEVNDAPVAVNDPLGNMEEDAPERTIPFITLTGNDSKGPANEGGQTLIVKTVTNPVGLTVSIVAGTVRFTPLPNYNGPASFQYTVEDNGTTSGIPDPRTSGLALAHFNITEVNDVPTAVNDTLPSIVENSGPQTIPFATLTANDLKGPANEFSQTLIVKTVSNPVGGTVSIVAGNVVFTPTANFNGTSSFDYTVEDNGTTNGVADPKTSSTATVTFASLAVADTPSVTNATTNANTQTTSGLVISRNPADGAEVTHFKITAITGGLLFKNDGVTPINNGDFITFAEGNAGLKFTPGTTNGSFTVQASLSASDAGLGGGTVTATIIVNPLGGVIRFSSANYNVAEGAGFRTITVERSGDTTQAVTVDYATSDNSNPADFVPCTAPGVGFASSRCDFTTALGTLRFAAGETSKTFNVLITNDNYVEGTETLDLTLSNPSGGAVLGVPSAAVLSILDDAAEPATNPIGNAADFVRAQYHDVLNREPDPAGLAFWTDNIEKCNDPARLPSGQTVAQCIDKQRESTAIAFFMSPEFQMTGGFVYHLYKGSLTGTPNYDGSLGRFPTFLEFMKDMGQVSEGIIVNGQISGPVVEANRNALAAEFVLRPEFVAKYGGLNNTLYVQELFNTTGIAATAAQKQALVDGLTNATETRASVLRKVVDGTVVISESEIQYTTSYGQAFINQENRLFVYLEYVGYLRRNPDPAGFVFWLGKLNFFDNDPFQAEMVRSFILSPEYLSRFGQ